MNFLPKWIFSLFLTRDWCVLNHEKMFKGEERKVSSARDAKNARRELLLLSLDELMKQQCTRTSHNNITRKKGVRPRRRDEMEKRRRFQLLESVVVFSKTALLYSSSIYIITSMMIKTDLSRSYSWRDPTVYRCASTR